MPASPVDLRHMRHFVAVAEERHFGRAAARLNMAQPPLSQSIRRLEEALGASLLDRSRRSVALTPAGRVFLDHARRTLAQAALAERLTRRAAATVAEVRVSFIGPALYRLLPMLIVGFREAVPDVAVRLFEQSSPEQIAGLASGACDVGFVSATFAGDGDTTRLVVERAPLVAAVPADWPIGADGTVTLAALAEQPFIVPPPGVAGGGSEGALAVFERVGVAPRVAQHATQIATIVSLVGAGLGCSLVGATAALLPHRNVRFVPIADDVAAVWELAMVWRSANLPPPAQRFVDFVAEHMRAADG